MTLMRLRTGALAVVAALLVSMVATGAGAVPPPCTDAATKGCFASPFSENGAFDAGPPQTPAQSKLYPTAVSAVVTPSGRIVYWNGLTGLEDCRVHLLLDGSRCAYNSQSRLLDLSLPTPTWYTPTPEDGGGDDMFCSDQRLLSNGNVLVAGGSDWIVWLPLPEVPDAPGGVSELYGSKDARLFSDTGASSTWTQTGDMSFRRWYPSMVTLPTGKVFIAGGVEKLLFNYKGTNVLQTETYNPATGSWTQNPATADKDLPLYARMHLLPNGRVFYTADGQMWGPAGESAQQLTWNVYAAYNPATQSWETENKMPMLGARNGGFSVMLPLKANASGQYTSAKILVAGGTLGVSPGAYLGTKFSELIDVSVDPTTGSWSSNTTLTGDLNNARWFSSGVLLPNGQVLGFSGADKDEVVAPGSETAVRQAELYNPATGTWTALKSGARDRTYHNSALLLADGSVLVGGHAPINESYGGQGTPANTTTGGSSHLKDPSFERFYPPYLYNPDGTVAARPVISAVQRGIAWGTDFSIQMSAPAAGHKVVLMRLPSVTHTTDMDMRAIELDSTAAGSWLSVTNTTNSNVAPPGYYYAFVLNAAGVPSVARIVKVGATADLTLAPPVAIS